MYIIIIIKSNILITIVSSKLYKIPLEAIHFINYFLLSSRTNMKQVWFRITKKWKSYAIACSDAYGAVGNTEAAVRAFCSERRTFTLNTALIRVQFCCTQYSHREEIFLLCGTVHTTYGHHVVHSLLRLRNKI